MLFNRQPSVGLPPSSTSVPPASSLPSRRRAGARSSATISNFARAATVGLLIATYLTVFCYLEGSDLSFETVTAANQKGEAEWEFLRQERNATRIRRAQEREERREQQLQRKNTKNRNNSPEEDDDSTEEEPEGFSLWRFLMFYTLLRILMRSRMEDQSLLQFNTTRTTTTRSARRAQRLAALDRQQRFRAWADRLNEQRVASGQRPLSLESLQLVLRERELHDGQDYDGLLQFHEESGPAMEALINGGAGMTEAEIDRLPLRVVQAEDDLLLSNSNTNQNDTYFCSVCLEAFQEGDSVRTVPCFHTFHQQCIDDWLSQKAVCPICNHAALG